MVQFRDRKEAGARLAARLRELGLRQPVVLGIPRGGVSVAAEVAAALNGQLGVVVARKLGAPGEPEFAIGAVTADGVAYVNETIVTAIGVSAQYLAAEEARQAAEARRREDAFDYQRRPDVRGRDVVVVDDGVATGATAIAAVRSVRAAGAARVVLAVPVGPPQTVEELRGEADEVVCLAVEPSFFAVGEFYDDFRPVSDAEVKAVLDAFASRTPAAPAS